MFEGEQQYVFNHVLIRDVAYDLLPRAKREERHAQAAEFFEGTTAVAGEAATALARHWRAGGRAGGARLGERPRRPSLPGSAATRAGGGCGKPEHAPPAARTGEPGPVPRARREIARARPGLVLRVHESGEVRRRHVAGDLAQRVDRVPSQP
jgi:hypothetical protein